MYDNTSRVIEVDIDEILPNRFQPRIQFDEEEILELSDSIKEHGVIQPLVVRTIGDKYEIIAGERRYKASVLAGKETVPVIIKNLNDKDSAEIALIENIQRKNLTPIEEALSYKKILDMGYITQENLASKLGKSQSAVANKIRLLNLSDEVQEALLENKISERHARSLLKLSTTKQQNSMLDRIINERLTVRKADEEIDKIKNSTEEDSEDDSQKIIEKGEIEMNNNMFAMPSAPENTQPSPSFDIFGSTTPNTPVVESAPAENMFAMPSVPTMESTPTVAEVPSAPAENMFAMPSVPTVESTPTVAEVPSAPTENMFAMPSVPTMESTPTVAEVPSAPAENMFAMPSVPTVESTPTVAEVPSAPIENMFTMPSVPAMESTPAVAEIPSAPAENMFAMPSVPAIESTPAVLEVPSAPVIPEMAPIIDNSNEMTQQSENMFSFGTATPTSEVAQIQPETVSTPEFTMPEPIIVTDYSKQYDPVMPNVAPPTPKVDFKEVISAIRECSSKIEKFGFKLDVEEYDLANLYQVIFKIEK